MIEAHNQDARRLGIVSHGISEEQDWNWNNGLFDMIDVSSVGEVNSDTI